MIIGIDNVTPGLSTGRNTPGGMRHYLQDLCAWLPRLGPQHHYLLFQPAWADPLDLPPDSPVETRLCRGVPKRQTGRILYEQSVYPSVVERAGVDVLLATNNTVPFRLRLPTVVVAQALQFFDFPRIYSPARLRYLRAVAPRALRRATRVIALSEESRATLIQRARVRPERVRVVPHALSDEIAREQRGPGYERGQAVLAKLAGDGPYILSVASFYWQKNLPRLVRAFTLLKQEQQIPHRLLLVGADSRAVTGVQLRALAERLGVGDSVVCPGVLEHELIPPFYDYADLTVMPSLSETFGHPVLEAMARGCPVVTSDHGSMAEVGGDCAELVNPYSVRAIAGGMARVLADPARREQMRAGGRERAASFTQERRARGYLAALEEAARAGSPRATVELAVVAR